MVSEQVRPADHVVLMCLFPCMRHVCENTIDTHLFSNHWFAGTSLKTSGGETYVSLRYFKCGELVQCAAIARVHEWFGCLRVRLENPIRLCCLRNFQGHYLSGREL